MNANEKLQAWKAKPIPLPCPVISVFFALILAGWGPSAEAGFPVIDAAHIAVNEKNSAIDLAEQIEHELNQIRQLKRLVEQIAQMEDYLERFGDPAVISRLQGLGQLLDDLGQAPQGATSGRLAEEASGHDALEYDGLGVYRKVGKVVVAQGDRKKVRDEARYKPEAAAQKTFENYRRVQEDVLARRAKLKAGLSEASRQLQAADTASEVQKMTGVVLGLQAELAAVDRELEFASMENLSRALENATQEKLETKAQREADAFRLREATRADAERYRLFFEPSYFRR